MVSNYRVFDLWVVEELCRVSFPAGESCISPSRVTFVKLD